MEKAFAFDKNLHFVSAKPSVPCAETTWPVLDLWCFKCSNKNKQMLNCLIEYLEEEELRVKPQNSIRFCQSR